MNPFLAPNYFIDFEAQIIQDFVKKHTNDSQSPEEKLIALYLAVRDGFRYNPHNIHFEPHSYKASQQISQTEGHCIDKANILAACSRAIGIPSRLHFANVRNHIGTEKLEEQLGTNVLVFHGYVSFFIHEKWVKATPAFNEALCQKLGVSPLEFDAKTDSVFQEFDPKAGKFMEYLHDYGHFSELPYELMIQEWKKHYAQSVEKFSKNLG